MYAGIHALELSGPGRHAICLADANSMCSRQGVSLHTTREVARISAGSVQGERCVTKASPAAGGVCAGVGTGAGAGAGAAIAASLIAGAATGAEEAMGAMAGAPALIMGAAAGPLASRDRAPAGAACLSEVLHS